MKFIMANQACQIRVQVRHRRQANTQVRNQHYIYIYIYIKHILSNIHNEVTNDIAVKNTLYAF